MPTSQTPPTTPDDNNPIPPGRIDSTPINYLALGDSYTIGESVVENGRYPVQLQRTLEKKGYRFTNEVKIIATTGWTTQNLLDAMAAQLSDSARYDMVSLLIGVNNQFQGRDLEEYKSQFLTLLQKAIQLTGGRKERVFVISIPDYGYTPFGHRTQASISPAIDKFNAANWYITDSAGVKYFDITPISRKGLDVPELVAGDGLHPSEIMYKQWVDLMLPGVEKLLQ